MKVALVYDRVNKWGGAERVLLALHTMFPDAPLYTSVYNTETASWARVFDITTSFLQNFPFASSTHEMYPLFMPVAFENFSFDEYDLVISITSEAAKGIITKPPTTHICICLTPTRYLWSGFKVYFENTLLRFVTKPLVWYLRTWDKIAAQRPDAIVAISEEVQRRIKKYYRRNSEVIYPPASLLVHSSQFTENKKNTKNFEQITNDYFLVVSRLSKFTSYKRVDIAIKAANKLKVPLKIIGGGKDMIYFKKMAGKTVEFVGTVTDEELAVYYRNCKALLFPGVEDFGLVMVEAQSFGKPVIAYRGGGALEIIREGKTGEFFDKQNYMSLAGKLENFNQIRYNSKDCKKNAERFSYQQFKISLHSFITTVINAKESYNIFL